MKERKEEIAQILTSEMSKVISEARGEIQEAIDMAYYMAGEGRRLFGDTVPSELRKICDECPCTSRDCRFDYSMEFPNCYRILEIASCTYFR